MCDQAKLVAWIDGELPGDEAATIEAHVRECQACRNRITTYQKVSEDVHLYCDAVFEAGTKPRTLPWIPVLATAAAAVIISFVVYSRTRVAPPSPAFTPIVSGQPAPIPAPLSVVRLAPGKAARHKSTPAPRKPRGPQWDPWETSVEIAIPAESIFAPGAMPEGMRLIGELRIGPDGSVRQVRFRQ
jgi:anti-sigma factor RsiW